MWGSKFGRCCFQSFKNSFFNLKNAFIKCFGNFLVAYNNLFGYTCNKVTSVYRDVIRRIIKVFHGSANLYFNLFCSTLTY